MEPGREHSGFWRDVWRVLWRDVALTLAVFALALQVLVPSGFMVSNEDGRGVIVICTGHGPLTVSSDDGKAPATPKAPNKQSDAPCAFAGHAAPFTAPLLAPLAGPVFIVPQDAGPRRLASLTPGRGLAAPPPPARGPPSLLI
jgi:hypothetical protein